MIKEMINAENKIITVITTDGEVFSGKCTYYMEVENEDEEAMIILDDKLALRESEIKSIEIID